MRSFRCRTPDDDDEYARNISAETVEDAAKEFAEYHDSSSCEFPDEQEVVVIRPDGSRETVTVCAAAVREYWVPRKRGSSL